MAGVKGRSGTNRNKDKPWADALRIVGYRDDRKKLLAIAEKCFDAAAAGDVTAMKEIGDRLDGKPIQESNVALTDQRYVARVPEKSETAEAWQQSHTPIQTIR
jgi:hypothetical protein